MIKLARKKMEDFLKTEKEDAILLYYSDRISERHHQHHLIRA